VRNRFPKFQERLAEIQGDRDQTEFADFLGVSRQTVGFYLRGERIPDIQVLVDIANKCNVSSDYLIGLSDVKTREPTLKQICDYSGLSEKAAKKLHDLCNKEECSVAHTFVDSFLCNNDIDIFEMFAGWATLASLSSQLHWKMKREERKNLSPADEAAHIDNYHKQLLETREAESARLWDEVLGRKPAGGCIEISNDMALHLYIERAKNYLEEILENAISDVELATEIKYGIKT